MKVKLGQTWRTIIDTEWHIADILTLETGERVVMYRAGGARCHWRTETDFLFWLDTEVSYSYAYEQRHEED